MCLKISYIKPSNIGPIYTPNPIWSSLYLPDALASTSGRTLPGMVLTIKLEMSSSEYMLLAIHDFENLWMPWWHNLEWLALFLLKLMALFMSKFQQYLWTANEFKLACWNVEWREKTYRERQCRKMRQPDCQITVDPKLYHCVRTWTLPQRNYSSWPPGAPFTKMDYL